jgi:hypothetical protein
LTAEPPLALAEKPVAPGVAEVLPEHRAANPPRGTPARLFEQVTDEAFTLLVASPEPIMGTMFVLTPESVKAEISCAA